jgi:hypothetical protein
MKSYCALVGWLLMIANGGAENVKLEGDKLEAVGVSMAVTQVENFDVVRVVKDAAVKEFDEPTFVRLRGVEFRNGTIEVKVLSKLLKDAPEFSRAFIGVAFRIDGKNSKFESIYLRPTNGRADDQLRRNRSIQYFSFPDYKFDRLRKEAGGVYETYADMGLEEWITMKIEVRGKRAKLFLNGNQQPALIVNDLKHGGSASGAVGLWVDVGTEGFFRDLSITHE